MDQWKITSPSGESTVAAHKAEVSSCGALKLSNNSGAVVQIFAPGHWTHVKAWDGASAGSQATQKG